MVAAGVFLGWAWFRAWPADPGTTRSLARHEERSRKLVDSLIIVATLLGVVLVVFALLRSQQKDLTGSAAAILAVVGVVAAWALVNTVYAFKYARMYYLDDRHWFDFDQDEDPAYSDFAFTAFSIGMSYRANSITKSSTPLASRRDGTRAAVLLLRHLRGRGGHQPGHEPDPKRVTHPTRTGGAAAVRPAAPVVAASPWHAGDAQSQGPSAVPRCSAPSGVIGSAARLAIPTCGSAAREVPTRPIATIPSMTAQK